MQGAPPLRVPHLTSQAVKVVAKKVKKGKLGADRSDQLETLLEKKERPTGSTSSIPLPCFGRKVDSLSFYSALSRQRAALTTFRG